MKTIDQIRSSAPSEAAENATRNAFRVLARLEAAWPSNQTDAATASACFAMTAMQTGDLAAAAADLEIAAERVAIAGRDHNHSDFWTAFAACHQAIALLNAAA